jgi:hypothetical protein
MLSNIWATTSAGSPPACWSAGSTTARSCVTRDCALAISLNTATARSSLSQGSVDELLLLLLLLSLIFLNSQQLITLAWI